MARRVNRLSPTFVNTSKEPGYHLDGAGLYLQITSAGGRSWIFRYRRDGRLRDMGLGPARDVSLKDARESAQRCRGLLREGLDPLEEKRKARALNRVVAMVADVDAGNAVYLFVAVYCAFRHDQGISNSPIHIPLPASLAASSFAT